MSPAVTRSTAASIGLNGAQSLSTPTSTTTKPTISHNANRSSSLDCSPENPSNLTTPSCSSASSSSSSNRTSLNNNNTAREPFVPKRKTTKTSPYTYLTPAANGSADSLPELSHPRAGSPLYGLSTASASALGSKPTQIESNPLPPPRPRSAFAARPPPPPPVTTVTTAPVAVASFSPQKTPVAGPSKSPIKTRNTTRSTSRTLSLGPTTASSVLDIGSQARPSTPSSSLSPSKLISAPYTRSVRMSTPQPPAKIKAALSADVAARIKSPKKHASTSNLRTINTSATTATAMSNSTTTTTPFATNTSLTGNARLSQQPHKVTPLLKSQAHASFAVSSPLAYHYNDVENEEDDYTDQHHHTIGRSQDAETGDSSFVYEGVDGDHATGKSGDGQGGQDEQDTVQVHIRLRPPKPREECAWIANPRLSTITLEPAISSSRTNSAALGAFTFDTIHTGSSNRPVYVSVARPLVRSALDGFDAVVFAYGQTASGKTFTLSGDEKNQEPGIIPRAIKDIFRGIRQSSAKREYLLRASYLEIWNETIKDLLEPCNTPQVRDDKRKKGGKGTTVHPLREEIVTTEEQVKELLARGQQNRHIGATDFNERSSRSHTCFKITIESWDRFTKQQGFASAEFTNGDTTQLAKKKVTVSELALIDLAGSEKYVSQGTERRTEGSHINKSLLTLGKVILALSEKSSHGSSNSNINNNGNGGSSASAANSNASSGGVHIPYRDSKLTRILQNSLSGHAKVAVVCTLNPSPTAVDESLSTLNFAKRIKKVNLHAKRNQVEGGGAAGNLLGAEAQALILRYQTEAVALRKLVADLQHQQQQNQHHMMDNAHQQQVLMVDDERIKELQERLDVIGSLVVRGGREEEDEEEMRTDGAVDSGNSSEIDDDANAGLPASTSNSSSLSNRTSSTARKGGKVTCSGASESAQHRTVARPVSPTKARSVYTLLLDDDEPSWVLREQLFVARARIQELTVQLSTRPALSSSTNGNGNGNGNGGDQEELIRRQAQQIQELEAICEMQAQDAPPKIREDVEREFHQKLVDLETMVSQKNDFIATLQTECSRLKKVNKKLIGLAHKQTADMVENLTTASGSPFKTNPANTMDDPSSSSSSSPFKNTTNTTPALTSPTRRLLQNPNSPTKPRPMSLYNFNTPSSTNTTTTSNTITNTPFGPPSKNHLSLQKVDEKKGALQQQQVAQHAKQRRSISNDYTLLQEGLKDLEIEMESRLTPSETFANVGALRLNE